MTRQRASTARDAFARVGTSPVTAADPDSETAIITASEKDGGKDGVITGVKDDRPAIRNAGGTTGRKAGGKAGAGRRLGRPRGPERVPLTIRILAATDDRLTAAVESTGQSPQYIVDAALAAYFDSLGL